MSHKQEQVFILIKPDGVAKGLIGQVLSRIEQRGLKIVALEMFQPTRDQIDNHYPKDEKWIARLGDKTLATYQKYGKDPLKEIGTTDNFEIGKMVRKWLVEFMISYPLVKAIIQGPHAIDVVRKIAGDTLPFRAELGTIRGDFSADSPAIANSEKRAVQNIIHVSETPEEASHEIAHWFGKNPKICDYKRVGEEIGF